MKTRKITVLTLLATVAFACTFKAEFRAGFETSFDPGSTGQSTLVIDDETDQLFLNGDIQVNEGALIISLTDPDQLAVIQDTIVAPADTTFSQNLAVSPGTWVLSYQSLNGSGTINLHLEL